MAKLLTILASALLLGYLVTELTTRFFFDNYFALLALTVTALVINGWFVARQGLAPAAAAAQTPARDRQRDRNRNRDRDGGQQKAKSKDDRKPREPRPKTEAKAASGPKPAPAGDAEQGEVKWFNRSKGYGFIIRENGDEIFVHQRSIVTEEGRRPALRDGQRVSFVVTSNEKGVQADQVSPIGA